MKILVCGSRGYTDCYAELVLALNELGATKVIHGACPNSADEVADALEYEGFEVEAFPADWTLYGKKAGFIRNTQMLDSAPDAVIAVWDGRSRGTLDTIKKAVDEYNLPVRIIPASEGK